MFRLLRSQLAINLSTYIIYQYCCRRHIRRRSHSSRSERDGGTQRQCRSSIRSLPVRCIRRRRRPRRDVTRCTEIKRLITPCNQAFLIRKPYCRIARK